jgi:hypothetical protein
MILSLLLHARIDFALLPECGQSRPATWEDIASIGYARSFLVFMQPC